jgi:hypothetical protein
VIVPEPKERLVERATREFLATVDVARAHDPVLIERDLLDRTNREIAMENTVIRSRRRYKPLQALAPSQIAAILIALHQVRRPATPETPDGVELVCVDPETGLCDQSQSRIRSLARRYNTELTIRGVGDVFAALRNSAPVFDPNDKPQEGTA